MAEMPWTEIILQTMYYTCHISGQLKPQVNIDSTSALIAVNHTAYVYDPVCCQCEYSD